MGDENTGYEELMGREGLGEINDNWDSLVIGKSIFPHKRIHKITWLSPDLSTGNQVDHMCITKKFRRSLQDVRIRRGAGVASDHYLLVAHVKLKLRRNWTGEMNQRKMLNTTLLSDSSKLQEFELVLTSKN